MADPNVSSEFGEITLPEALNDFKCVFLPVAVMIALCEKNTHTILVGSHHHHVRHHVVVPNAAASRWTCASPNVLLERMTSSCSVGSFCSTRVSSASHDFADPPGPLRSDSMCENDEFRNATLGTIFSLTKQTF